MVGIVHLAYTDIYLASILQFQVDVDNDGVVRVDGLRWRFGDSDAVWSLVFRGGRVLGPVGGGFPPVKRGVLDLLRWHWRGWSFC